MFKNGCKSLTTKLPDGRIISIADLPPAGARWVASRKELVVHSVAYGLIDREEVKERYGISDEELDSWCRAMLDHGRSALKVTKTQEYRKKD